MKKTILALALAAGLTSFAGSAKAGLVNYYFSTTGNNSSGNLFGGTFDPSDKNFSGEIFGLSDSGTSQASKVEIHSFGGKKLTSPIVQELPPSYFNNWIFTVENGNVSQTYWQYTANSVDAQLTFWDFPWGYANQCIINSTGDVIFSTNPYEYTLATDASIAAVPEPSQVAASLLLAAGIAGFVIVKRRQEASELEALAA
jgi:hypothetical protein